MYLVIVYTQRYIFMFKFSILKRKKCVENELFLSVIVGIATLFFTTEKILTLSIVMNLVHISRQRLLEPLLYKTPTLTFKVTFSRSLRCWHPHEVFFK